MRAGERYLRKTPADMEPEVNADIHILHDDEALLVIDPDGLPAITHFRVLRRNPDGTALLEARPFTGRTNQIRVHLWHLGHPLVGDPAYLKNRKLGTNQTLRPSDPQMCLHAHHIAIRHPLDNTLVRFESSSPTWSI